MSINEDKRFMRHRDIIATEDISPVTLIGCGAIGSAVGIVLTKLGAPFIQIWDGDKVEEHNIANQYFGVEHMGKNKAEALADEMFRYSPDSMKTFVSVREEMFGRKHHVSTPIVILGLDSLKARRSVMRTILKGDSAEWVIDVRMAGEVWEIETVNLADEKEVKTYLKGISKKTVVMEVPCTARSVIYTIATAAAHTVNIVKKIALEEYDNIPLSIYEDLGNYKFPRTFAWRERTQQPEESMDAEIAMPRGGNQSEI